MLITEQKSVLYFYSISPGKTTVLLFFLFFSCNLTDKPLVQQAAHILPLKSYFPIVLWTARLEGKIWEVLSTYLKLFHQTVIWGHRKAVTMSLWIYSQCGHLPHGGSREKPWKLLSLRFTMYFTLKHILNAMHK